MIAFLVTYLQLFIVVLRIDKNFNLLGDFLNISLLPSGFDQNIVGQRQEVICSVSVPPGVDPDTVELGWFNEDDIITNDSRVTIIESTSNFNYSTLFTIIQFDPLIEKDEDEYTCYAIINGSFISDFIYLHNLRSKQSHTYVHMHIYIYIHMCIIRMFTLFYKLVLYAYISQKFAI